jgi:hypothetical protein
MEHRVHKLQHRHVGSEPQRLLLPTRAAARLHRTRALIQAAVVIQQRDNSGHLNSEQMLPRCIRLPHGKRVANSASKCHTYSIHNI